MRKGVISKQAQGKKQLGNKGEENPWVKTSKSCWVPGTTGLKEAT